MDLCLTLLTLALALAWLPQSQAQDRNQKLNSQTKIIDGIPESFARTSLQEGLEDFTQSMYIYMKDHTNSPNFVFSPLSIHSALSMLFLGTKPGSQTELELSKAMNVINSGDLLKLSYRRVVQTYKNQDTFLYGNHFWVQDGFSLKPKFQKTVLDNMDSGVETIDFGASNSVNKVNSWISRMTGGKIQELVKKFSSDTSVFLANALYFKEQWKIPFEDKDFRTGLRVTGDFQTLDGLVTLPMIQQTTSETGYKVIKNKGTEIAEVITLPYKNELFEMQIILPRSLTILESSMDRNKERDLSRGNRDYFNTFSDEHRSDPKRPIEDVYLTMPTFNIRTDMDAAEPLQEFGARKVFTTAAELDELATGRGPLYVSSISHTSVMEVTKEGSEGAAATGVQIVLLSASAGEQKNIIVNRPFIFVVQDRVNKIPVLVGRVTDPSRLGQ